MISEYVERYMNTDKAWNDAMKMVKELVGFTEEWKDITEEDWYDGEIAHTHEAYATMPGETTYAEAKEAYGSTEDEIRNKLGPGFYFGINIQFMACDSYLLPENERGRVKNRRIKYTLGMDTASYLSGVRHGGGYGNKYHLEFNNATCHITGHDGPCLIFDSSDGEYASLVISLEFLCEIYKRMEKGHEQQTHKGQSA